MPTKKPRRPPRIRRAPDEARALILQAAERVLSTKGPDAAGLKDVAKDAGVSHALVTHYFGTYEALVRAVLARRSELARLEAERIVATSAPGPDSVLQFLFAHLRDPLQVRLATWALLSSRETGLLPLDEGALAGLMKVIAQRRKAQFGASAAGSEEVALDITLALAAGYGFALGGEAFARALGRAPISHERFARRLSEVIGNFPARKPQ
jgi:AcrR family transcriptional regulator